MGIESELVGYACWMSKVLWSQGLVWSYGQGKKVDLWEKVGKWEQLQEKAHMKDVLRKRTSGELSWFLIGLSVLIGVPLETVVAF